MAFWVVIAIAVGFQVLSGLLMRPAKPKPEERPNLPVNDGSTPIPVAMGEVLIKGPMLLDYFDYFYRPIKKVNLATFGLTSIIIGYRYFLGMVFGLCWNDNNENIQITGIAIDNKWVFRQPDIYLDLPTVGGAPQYNQTDLSQIYYPNLFGASNQEGGVAATWAFHNGRDLTGLSVPLIANPYWQSQRPDTPLPHLKDIAYFVWYGPSSGLVPFVPFKKLQASGYIGNSANLWPISFRLTRWPQYVSAIGSVAHLTAGDEPFDGTNGSHANPVDCIYMLLVNTHYGKGINPDDIEFEEFQFAALAVCNEQLGFSYLWTQASSVDEMIAEILRFVNGVLWTDMQTGKIRFTLIRNDYNPDTLPVLTNGDLLEIESYRIGSWEDTFNEVRVTFPDHSTVDFKEEAVVWYNDANKSIQGITRATEIHYEGCPTRWLAQQLAEREGRALSLPPIELKAKVDRKQFNWHPGKVFKWSWPEQGLNNIVMRVTTMQLGTILDGAITIEAARDVFGAGVGSATPPDGSIWTDPLDNGSAQDAIAVAGEVPHWIQRDDYPRLFGMAARPSAAHPAYDGAIDGTAEALETDFTPTGTLTATYPQLSPTDYDTTGFTINNVKDGAEIEAGGESEITNEGAGLAIIGDPATGAHEWIAFESITDNEDGTYTLDNVWRGLLDTPPREHASGARVWFFKQAVAFLERTLTNSATYNFEALTRTTRSQLQPEDATNHNVTMQRRAYRPLPPYYVRLGGSYTNLQQDTGDLVFTWREHSRLNFTALRKQSATTTAPESGVTYEIDIYDASTGTPVLLRNVTGLSSATYTYTNVDELSDLGGSVLAARLLFKFYSSRDELRSLYPWERYVYRVDPASFGNLVTVNGATVTVDGAFVTQS